MTTVFVPQLFVDLEDPEGGKQQANLPVKWAKNIGLALA